MSKPSLLALDSNACIIHSLSLVLDTATKFEHSDSRFVKQLIRGCLKDAIAVGTFKTAKEECYRNITGAAVQLARRMGGLKDNYVELNVRKFAQRNLISLFKEISEFVENHSPEELIAARDFFVNCKVPNSNPHKDNIPGENDLILFVSTHNLTRDATTHFVSEDSHFVDYVEKIEKSDYRVSVLPIQTLPLFLKQLGWHCSDT